MLAGNKQNTRQERFDKHMRETENKILPKMRLLNKTYKIDINTRDKI